MVLCKSFYGDVSVSGMLCFSLLERMRERETTLGREIERAREGKPWRQRVETFRLMDIFFVVFDYLFCWQ